MLFALHSLAVAQADMPLKIMFSDRPPLYFLSVEADGRQVIRGSVYDLVKTAVQTVGLTATFARLPSKRVINAIRDNDEALCGMGWFKTPERELFAQFSAPLHDDQPWVVIVRPGVEPEIIKAGSLKALLENQVLRPSLMDGISFGTYLDEQLATARILDALALARSVDGPQQQVPMRATM